MCRLWSITVSAVPVYREGESCSQTADLVSLAVDVPELDQEKPGRLRTSWFPLVMSEPAPFLVILLIAASHYISVHGGRSPDVKVNLLQLRYEAIRAINQALADPKRSLSDAAVGAVAKMASYEAMYGSVETYHTHMKGLVRMVALRGGLSSLGLDGLLRRMCVWIDRNAAFLNGLQSLYFPGATLAPGETPTPYPGQFLAES